ncbi:LPS glycosyltransferase [Beauveria bassiana ARSEF 2860]|uniref:LPS glycosyltransferase n=1 Tax=Beauveria bassiana (strain ARSEF 2860) TaxID=655819 RepID=J4VT34_BEAB2|nr:LPS glycosyltransferase [Beauveria bassiana ARSEF 2860]EJP61725.1 LPS glycosyltransferase [Beauveria bassiana ARSEF 2860]
MAWSFTLIKYHDNVKEPPHAYGSEARPTINPGQVFIALDLYSYFYFDKATSLKGLLLSDRLLDDLSKAAQNETLGFEKIFYISMPHRQDRQDSMTMLATSTNIRLILQNGVDGNTIHEKARPKGSQGLRPEQLGCWRSHANVWRTIINERIETAIILEDDADWDVRVHDIFQTLSLQMRKRTAREGEPRSHEAHAPYGLDWDLLYVGTCWNINPEVRPVPHIYQDTNAPNSTEMSYAYQKELEYWGASSSEEARVRVIAPSWYPVCTVGYAVTLQGAQKLLYTVGNEKGLNGPVDLAMISRIQSGHLKSFTVVPPLVTPWKTGTTSDSDIDDLNKAEGELPQGSDNLRLSGRKALAATLDKDFKD